MSLDTRGYENARLLPRSFEDRLIALLGQLTGVALLALVALLWASLVSWSVADPSLTYATTNTPENWLGPMGAIISDLAFQTLGLAAIAALIPPIAWSFELLRQGRLSDGRVRIGLYPVAALAMAGAASAFPVFGSWPLHYGFGGALGDGIFTLVSSLFALLNEQRAGLAAGLVLIAGAAVVSPKAISLNATATMKAALASALSSMSNRDYTTWPSVTDAQQAHAAHFGDVDDLQAGSEPAFNGSEPSIANEARRGQRSWWPLGKANSHTGVTAAGGNAAAQHHPSLFEQAGYHPHVGGEPAMREPYFDVDAAGARGPGHHQPSMPDWHHTTQSSPGVEAFLDDGADTSSAEMAKRFAPRISPQAQAANSARTGPTSNIAAAAQAVAKLGAGAKRAGMPRPFHFDGGQPGAWRRPSLNLLAAAPSNKPRPEATATVLRGNARLLEEVLSDFGVKGEIKDVRPGPVVTLYEFEPARGIKSSRVINLADDIARLMSVTSVRAAVVPGRNVIGLELPNARREQVSLRGVFESPAYAKGNAILPLALGKGIGGEPIIADLARMPHLLVAGTTGSGKSVGVNAMILSLLYRHAPDDCKLLMIDPKMLELSVYNDIPHLLTPVVTDSAQAVTALNWAVREMEERYKRMAALNVRNIDVFNNRVRNAIKRGERLGRTVQTGFDERGQAVFEDQHVEMQTMPRIVIVVDEFADLMSTAGKDVEAAVQRLAQMARAAGIHLIMATQRPSVDVITGTIKANFPTRISFKVTSKIDSRTILNAQGAEGLLGQGDMLYSTGAGDIVRVHGPFVSDEEVEAIANELKRQRPANYVAGLLDTPEADAPPVNQANAADDDYDKAVAVVMRDRKASTSYIQRRLSIGYNRAANFIERMEREGLISAADNVGRRTILVGKADAAE